jgi:hypothetical protein
LKWWFSLQPVAREGEKLLRAMDADEQWVETKKGTINGFYNVVVSLGWWLKALKTDVDRANFDSILDDVLWVANQMVRNPDGTPKPPKRARSNSDVSQGREGGTSKRSVFPAWPHFFSNIHITELRPRYFVACSLLLYR